MATKINVTRCAKRNDATALSSVTCNSATAGAAQDYTLTFDGADDHSGIIVHNAGTKDITVKLSDADGCGAVKNKALNVYSGSYVLIPIESGRRPFGTLCFTHQHSYRRKQLPERFA